MYIAHAIFLSLKFNVCEKALQEINVVLVNLILVKGLLVILLILLRRYEFDRFPPIIIIVVVGVGIINV